MRVARLAPIDYTIVPTPVWMLQTCSGFGVQACANRLATCEKCHARCRGDIQPDLHRDTNCFRPTPRHQLFETCASNPPPCTHCTHKPRCRLLRAQPRSLAQDDMRTPSLQRVQMDHQAAIESRSIPLSVHHLALGRYGSNDPPLPGCAHICTYARTQSCARTGQIKRQKPSGKTCTAGFHQRVSKCVCVCGGGGGGVSLFVGVLR